MAPFESHSQKFNNKNWNSFSFRVFLLLPFIWHALAQSWNFGDELVNKLLFYSDLYFCLASCPYKYALSMEYKLRATESDSEDDEEELKEAYGSDLHGLRVVILVFL